MESLAPGRDHGDLAWAISSQASSLEEAALATAVTFRESSFDNAAVGDGGRSVCAFQILHGRHDMSPEQCTSAGLALLRRSALIDPSHPVAAYARGSRWRSPEAQRLSNDRCALARRLLASTR